VDRVQGIAPYLMRVTDAVSNARVDSSHDPAAV
jgi:hypothetical protein